MKIERIIEKISYLEELEVYKPGSIKEVSERFGIPEEEIMKLDANENLFLPETFIEEILSNAVRGYKPNFYPDPKLEEELKEAIGDYLSVDSECIILGNGSDQLIDLIARVFLRNNGKIASISPSFVMYKWYAQLSNGNIIEVPLSEEFDVKAEDFLSKTENSEVCILCSPNNPTGNLLNEKEVKKIINKFEGLVIVDEAYAEFSESSFVSEIENYDNLMVFRTFSKAFGLAGLRLGYGIANRKIIELLSRAIPPFHINSFTLKVGVEALRRVETVLKSVEEIKKEREKLMKELNSISGVKAYESNTNFILVRFKEDANRIHEQLIKRGILVRNVSNAPMLENCLRITIGKPEMNSRLISEIKEILRGD